MIELQQCIDDYSNFISGFRHTICDKSQNTRNINVKNAYNEDCFQIDYLLEQKLLDFFRQRKEVKAAYSEETGFIRFREKGIILIIDPLDGTKNFNMGLSYYACSIGILNELFQVIGGLVINLPSGRRFWAIKDYGAFKEDKRIICSNATNLRNIDAIFVGLSKKEEEIEIIGNIMTNTNSIRAMGCAALDLCCLACGNCGIFIDLSKTTKIVDIVAAAIICNEAGAIVKDLNDNNIVDLLFHSNNKNNTIFNNRFYVLAASNEDVYQFLNNLCSKHLKINRV